MYPIRHQNMQQIGRQHILRTLSSYHFLPTRHRIQEYQQPSNATIDFQEIKYFMKVNHGVFQAKGNSLMIYYSMILP